MPFLAPPHTSVFLDLPQSTWVASNALAFAILDGYPVSPGHTLVITRRLVSTWFDATSEEQQAILALVDEVKTLLDQGAPRPDGYNVGFNAGEAAGQTVMHLHVHVIPRYLGDMDDPRGGVRHVIPSFGNYKRDVHSLTTGGEEDPFIRALRPLFARANNIAIVAAFVQQSGLKSLRSDVENALRRGANIRILTGDYLNITQVAALEELLDWVELSAVVDENDDDDDKFKGTLDARVIEVQLLPGRTGAFHPKSWRFESKDFGVLFVGSSNISQSALTTGIEWNLRVDRDQDAGAWTTATDAFDALWAQARSFDEDWIRDYSERARTRPHELPSGEADGEPLAPLHDPHPVQVAALEALAKARAEGRRRALVVMATGLGKTWLAAFDVRQLADEMGKRPRVLFLAHRREILRQASTTFRTLAREHWPNARFGWFAGGNRNDLDADIVFASVMKLCRPEHLARLEPRSFDYVVVDEVHHATASSYRKIIDRLDPIFMLGLTATPDRADEADVVGLFDDYVAFRADIGEGIDQKRLVPFAYFGLEDVVDYATIPWRSRRFDPAALAEAVQTQVRMERLWQAWTDHPGQRTLVFCCSVEHATYVRDWLVEREVTTRIVHSKPGSDDRDEALEDLGAGRIEALCSVDMFNEGVDVPTVDRVVMLRPTESPVLFLQQLGRGLRKAEGKDQLTIIDFVGNHRMFLERVRQLMSFASSMPSSIKSIVDLDGPLKLPNGCSVDASVEAKAILDKLLPKGGTAVERIYDELRQARDVRPSAGELERMDHLPSTLRKAHGSWSSSSSPRAT